MSQMGIRSETAPIRLFESDFLEFFTHIHPVVVLIIWVPVTTLMVVWAALTTTPATGWIFIPLGFVAGLFLWTITEYTLHRFVFHFEPRGKFQERISFLFHGVHHAQPMSKSRLVMPPPVSIPLALIFYGLYTLVFGVLFGIGDWVKPIFAGTLCGYIIYDMIHYAVHHFRLRSRAMKYVRSHHMRHHSVTPDKRFGVSSPLWDLVFGTLPRQTR